MASLSTLKFLVVVDEEEIPDVALPVYRLHELCQQAPLTRADDVSIGNDLAALLYTSGSTGKPKGVMLSHAQVMAGASIVSDYLEISDRDRLLAVLPFSFDAGLNQLTTAFQQGATLVLINFVFAREIVQQLLQERITALAGVPTLWNLLVQTSSGLHKQPLPNLRYITNTGGTMSQVVLAELRWHLPSTQIFLMYGLTEAFRSTYLPPEELDRRPTSIGKAIPNTEILVIDDAGNLCAPGVVGELVHRGPTVCMGYWNQPELAAQRLRAHPLLPAVLAEKERVCYSGDLVKTDAEGFLYFVERRDAMIKSSGFRISPTEIEETLMKSELLQGAAAIGVADKLLTQTVKAFVVPKSDFVQSQTHQANVTLAQGGEEPTHSELTNQLIRFCKEQLPSYMVPKRIEVLAALPKTTSGKVDYPALKQFSNQDASTPHGESA